MTYLMKQQTIKMAEKFPLRIVFLILGKDCIHQYTVRLQPVSLNEGRLKRKIRWEDDSTTLAISPIIVSVKLTNYVSSNSPNELYRFMIYFQ